MIVLSTMVANPLNAGPVKFRRIVVDGFKQRCEIILARILKRKVPMKRSFHNLNGDTLLVKIRRELEL